MNLEIATMIDAMELAAVKLAGDTGISSRSLHECVQVYRSFPIVRTFAQLARPEVRGARKGTPKPNGTIDGVGGAGHGSRAMQSLTVEVPGEVMESLRVPSGEAPARLKRELALRLYQKGLLTFGKARALAELSKWEFSDLLGVEGIARRYDEADLAVDEKTLGRLS